MRGLCTSEGEKFKNFFALVQEEAKKKDAIFFLESGDGRDFEYGDLDCADLFGWLIPAAEADEFEGIWKKNPRDLKALDRWYDVLGFAEWEMGDGKIEIQFNFYD